MISRPAKRLMVLHLPSSSRAQSQTIRHFSTSKPLPAKNRIYTPVRRPEEFQTYLSISTSTRTPLLTLWTASWCTTCRTVSPVLSELIDSGVGEEEGGVTFVEVEFDSQDIMNSDLATTFAITSIPTLLAFNKGFAETGTRLVDARKMRDREGLKEWIREEARRRDGVGGGGAGGGGGGGFFGNWFGGGR